MAPTRLHVEPKLLPIRIVSLIGIPPALVGKLTAFENFVAELLKQSTHPLNSRSICAASCQSRTPGPSLLFLVFMGLLSPVGRWLVRFIRNGRERKILLAG